MAAPNPFEALTEMDCPHTQSRVACLRCAADAVRPAFDDLEARLRASERGRAMLRARLMEVVGSAAQLGEADAGRDPAPFLVEAGPLNRARGALGVPLIELPPGQGEGAAGSEDWETVALEAQRAARVARQANAEIMARSVGYAQKALDADARLREAEARATVTEEAVRASIVEFLTANLLQCPDGHTGAPPPGCVWCWRNAALEQAIGAAQGRYGSSPGAVRKRIDRTRDGDDS